MSQELCQISPVKHYSVVRVDIIVEVQTVTGSFHFHDKAPYCP